MIPFSWLPWRTDNFLEDKKRKKKQKETKHTHTHTHTQQTKNTRLVSLIIIVLVIIILTFNSILRSSFSEHLSRHTHPAAAWLRHWPWRHGLHHSLWRRAARRFRGKNTNSLSWLTQATFRQVSFDSVLTCLACQTVLLERPLHTHTPPPPPPPPQQQQQQAPEIRPVRHDGYNYHYCGDDARWAAWITFLGFCS